MHYLFHCFFIFAMVFVGSEGKPSFMDAVPVVSQVKTSFLYIIGKEDQALQTLANFKNCTHLWESVKHIDNSIPIYGHVKAFIVGVNGNGEDAQIILEAAHKSTMIAGGFFLAGPIGGVGGSIFADSSMTLTNWKPKGTIDHVVHLKNKTASENIDLILDLMASATGTTIKKPAESIGVRNINFEMKKTAPLAVPEITELRKDSTTSLIVKEGSKTAQVFVQPYTPYEPVPSSGKTDGKKQQ